MPGFEEAFMGALGDHLGAFLEVVEGYLGDLRGNVGRDWSGDATGVKLVSVFVMFQQVLEAMLEV